MTEELKYMKLKNSLENFCKKEGFSCKFVYDTYPMMLSVRPLQGIYDQISLLEQAEDGNRISQDAVLTFSRVDGEIVTKILGTFTLPDKKFQTLKNFFKQLSDLYLQFFHRTIVQMEILRTLPAPEDEDQ